MYRVWSRAKAAGHAESHQLPCSSQFITLDWFYDPPLVPLFCGRGIFFFHTRFYMHTHTLFCFFLTKTRICCCCFVFVLFYCCTHSRTTVKQKCVVSRSLSQLVDRNGWFRDAFGFLVLFSRRRRRRLKIQTFFFFSFVGGRRDVHTHKLQRIAPALLICVSMGHLNTRPRSAAFRRPARLYFLIAPRLFVVAMAVSRTARRVSTTVTMNETCILAYFLFIYFLPRCCCCC